MNKKNFNFEIGKYSVIYIYRINDEEHKGSLKIGMTSIDCSWEEIEKMEPESEELVKASKKRIDECTKTAGVSYEFLYCEAALRKDKEGAWKAFTDHDVHSVLKNSGIERKEIGKAREWFLCDLKTAKNAIAAVKEGREALKTKEKSKGQSPVVFRPEQKEAIEKTVKRFKDGGRMLWNAKPRFGKTLCTLEVVKRMDFRRTLILTHRPVVKDGWFEDFDKIFYDKEDFHFGSKPAGKNKEQKGESFEALEKHYKDKKKKAGYVYFASMQDLRGSEKVGGRIEKNDEVYSVNWDCIVVDEAHEGTQTELGKKVVKELKKPKTKILLLSGTPYDIIDGYNEEEIFTYSYDDEQRAKREWESLHGDDSNPYADLPNLNIFTYDLADMCGSYINSDIYFNFGEFFSVDEGGDFVHKEDIANFLNLLCKKDEEINYPFATEKFREAFRHTFWVVPGVKEAKALCKALKKHVVFGNYEIVNVAGEGLAEPVEESEEEKDKKNMEALKKVRKAIGKKPEESRTITVSCGRLTTGVTVKEWTAVLMLKGGTGTAASTYVQTMFRAQNPANIGGVVKKECYLFDFAPERTLRMVVDYEGLKRKTKTGKEGVDPMYINGDGKSLAESTIYISVVAIEGGKMREIDAEEMVQRVKKAYIDRVVSRGFEDSCLFDNKRLGHLNSKELEKFEALKKIVGRTKSSTGEVVVNENGTKEDANEQEKSGVEKGKKEVKKTLSEKESKSMRDRAIEILRSVSKVMGSMIYGAEIDDEEEGLTIDNFCKLVDDKSWEEFMPSGVSKDLFEEFKEYFNADVFAGAAKRLREKVKEADGLRVRERIEKIATIMMSFKNPDKETVFTPWRVVNMHLGKTLGGECFYNEGFENYHKTEKKYGTRKVNIEGLTDKVLGERNAKILDINSKTGVYSLYVAYSLFSERLKEYLKEESKKEDEMSPEEEQRIWDEVLRENIFAVCRTPMAESITRRTLAGFRKVEGLKIRCYKSKVRVNDLVEAKVIKESDKRLKKDKNGDYFYKEEGEKGKWEKVRVADITEVLRVDEQKVVKELKNPKFWGIGSEGTTEEKKEEEMIRFTAVVGNPPYQIKQEATSDTPIYHKFLESSFELADIVTLIHPARFLFKAGKTPSEFNKKILNDDHFKVVRYEPQSVAIFDNVDIKGGIVISLRNANKNYGKIGEFFSFEELKTIKHKVVDNTEFKSIKDIIYLQNRFNLEALYKDYPQYKDIVGSAGREKRFTTSIFYQLDVFTEQKKYRDDIKVIGIVKNKREYRYIPVKYVEEGHVNLNKYKVLVPKSNGSGSIGEVLSTPLLGEPLLGYTFSFIGFGAFDKDKKTNAEACLKYIKTRFTRCMLGILKVTQDNLADTWRYVPLQKFTDKSDIDWSQSVEEIDRQLYKKYGLDEKEVAFVEKNIKPME